MKILFALVVGVLFAIQTILINSEEKVQSNILTANSVSWDNGAFQYPTGEANIIVQIIKVFPHGKALSLSIHCHLMPLAAYVLKGAVKVVKPSGETKTFKEGDAFIEVMNKWHKGVFEKNTELVVFYAGNDALPLSVNEDGDPSLTSKCE